MKIVSDILVIAVAVEHIFIMLLEMFFIKSENVRASLIPATIFPKSISFNKAN